LIFNLFLFRLTFKNNCRKMDLFRSWLRWGKPILFFTINYYISLFLLFDTCFLGHCISWREDRSTCIFYYFFFIWSFLFKSTVVWAFFNLFWIFLFIKECWNKYDLKVQTSYLSVMLLAPQHFRVPFSFNGIS